MDQYGQPAGSGRHLQAEDERRRQYLCLRTYFGRIDPPLGQVLRLRHGGLDLPLDGAPDVLCAASASAWEQGADGRLEVNHGDSFVRIMAWDGQGRVSSLSFQPYGAAATRPASPH